MSYGSDFFFSFVVVTNNNGEPHGVCGKQPQNKQCQEKNNNNGETMSDDWRMLWFRGQIMFVRFRLCYGCSFRLSVSNQRVVVVAQLLRS
jgi:hypothetical protein